MSYEGDQEYLCTRGHYQCHGCYEEQPTVCGQHGCKERIEWQHSIDHTNGYDKNDPSTFSAPTVELGWDDIQMTDHYGSKYFIKHVRLAPAPGSHWTKAPTDEEIAAHQAEWEARMAPFKEPSNKWRIFDGEKLIWTGDTEAEFEIKCGEYLEQGLNNLAGYGPTTDVE